MIYGVVEQREFTLPGSVPSRSKREIGARVASPDRQSVIASDAIIGAHVIGEEDPAFAGAEVSVEALGLEAGSSVYEEVLAAPDGKMDGNGRMSVTPIEAQAVVVGDTEYRLVYSKTLPYFDRCKGEAVGRIRCNAVIRVAQAEPF